jgi:hypothetical protein
VPTRSRGAYGPQPRRRKHRRLNHYSKSSLFCGHCGSRMSSRTHAAAREGDPAADERRGCPFISPRRSTASLSPAGRSLYISQEVEVLLFTAQEVPSYPQEVGGPLPASQESPTSSELAGRASFGSAVRRGPAAAGGSHGLSGGGVGRAAERQMHCGRVHPQTACETLGCSRSRCSRAPEISSSARRRGFR